jgi:hypothetical protein
MSEENEALAMLRKNIKENYGAQAQARMDLEADRIIGTYTKQPGGKLFLGLLSVTIAARAAADEL